MIWIIPALLCGILRAFAFDVNRKYKIDAGDLNFYRLAYSVVLITPITLFFTWPESTKFYLFAAIAGVIVGIGDQYLWKLSSNNNSRVASMFDAVNSLGSFIFWILITPTAIAAFIEDVSLAIGIVISYTLMFYGMWVLKKSPYTWNAFRTLLAVCFFNSINAVLVKIALNDVPVDITYSIIYMLIMYVVAFITSAIFIYAQTKALPKFSKEIVKPSIFLGTTFSAAGICVLYAIATAENPGYAVMLAALAPVWLVIIHKIKGVQDNTKALPVLLIVLSSIILIMLTK